MTKSSLTTMFNRLPIYSRPKEPAIGHPVLTESSNARLSPDRGIRIVGLDGRPYRSGAFDTAKGLPQIPSVSSSLLLSSGPSLSHSLWTRVSRCIPVCFYWDVVLTGS